MSHEIPLHSLPIHVILSRVQFIGSPVLVLLVPIITKVEFSGFLRLFVLYVRRVFFESRSPLESDDRFLHFLSY